MGKKYNLIFLMCISLFFFGITFVFAEEETEQNQLTPRILFLPGLSYELIAFDNIQFHNPSASLNMLRFNTMESGRMFVISLSYNPNFINNIPSDYPELYHNAALSIMQRIDRHFINAAFMVMTEKPLYGGSRSFMGMATYSYNLIKRDHFSMNLGIGLLIMDIGIMLNNDTPWMVWPIPSASFSWEYEWVVINLIPGARLTIAPKKPVSLILSSRTRGYDASLRYRIFKDDDSPSELISFALGFKNDSNNVNLADGRKYGISYNALYGTVRLFRILEMSGGWTFNGKEGTGKMEWDSLFSSFGYSDRSIYERNIGSGFFLLLSARMNM